MARTVAGGKERRGALFTPGRQSCSREVCQVYSARPSTFTDSRAIVTGIYTKTGGKNSRYSWTQAIANISGAATIHVQLFRHTFRDRHSETHNQPIPGMRRFEIIPPWRFLCAASTPTRSPSGEVILAPGDRAIFEVLERSALSIGICLQEFSGKRGQKTAEEEGDGDADADD